VLLLNATLTVEQANAGAHQGKGWERFTDQAIRALNDQRDGIVFMLWGSYAQKKGAFIDQSRHLVLKSVHPSPLSAYRGFLGCKHFSAANRYLQQLGQKAIDWQLPSEDVVIEDMQDS
jgi:uracil-DNA glycosylase